MGFHDKYTTAEKISQNVLADDLKGKGEVKEKDKIVISNDTFALCEQLECLNNRLGRV